MIPQKGRVCVDLTVPVHIRPADSDCHASILPSPARTVVIVPPQINLQFAIRRAAVGEGAKSNLKHARWSECHVLYVQVDSKGHHIFLF